MNKPTPHTTAGFRLLSGPRQHPRIDTALSRRSTKQSYDIQIVYTPIVKKSRNLQAAKRSFHQVSRSMGYI